MSKFSFNTGAAPQSWQKLLKFLKFVVVRCSYNCGYLLLGALALDLIAGIESANATLDNAGWPARASNMFLFWAAIILGELLCKGFCLSRKVLAKAKTTK